MSIQAFIANFKGGARPSLFRVTQLFPAGVGAGEADKKLTYMCKGAQLPGSAINPIDTYYMGRQIKVPGDRTFEEQTLTIINDVDFSVRNAFERWMMLINSHEGNIGLTPPSLIMVDVKVEQLDRDGKVIKEYDMVGAWPTNISAIDLSFEQADTIEEFTVTMAYQYWQSVKDGVI